MKFKHYSILVLIFVVVFSSAVSAQQTIRLSHNEAPDWSISVDQALSLVVKNIIESKTQGEYKVEIYPSGQLGGSQETVRQLQRGAIEMGTANLAHLESLYEPLEIFNMPYIFQNEETALHLLNESDYGKQLFEKIAEETNIRVLGVGRLAFRHVTNNKRPIHTPEDMAGLTFRTMQVPMYMMIVESLGGRPTPIEWTEVYSALETGIADGQENPFQSVIVASLYEVQDYMTLDGHVLTYKVFCVNEDWYQSLNDDMKQILHHAARDGNRASYVIGRMADVLGYDDLTSKGMEIYTPTAEEMELFKEATIPTAKEYLSEKYGMEEIDKLLNAIEESEKALGYK